MERLAGSCTPAPTHSILLCAGGFTESEQGEVRFPEISTAILEKVCQYFYYKLRYQNS
jgi:transcription elongation factor B subunit 1